MCKRERELISISVSSLVSFFSQIVFDIPVVHMEVISLTAQTLWPCYSFEQDKLKKGLSIKYIHVRCNNRGATVSLTS